MALSFPGRELCWAAEVEWSHGERLAELLRAAGEPVCALPAAPPPPSPTAAPGKQRWRSSLAVLLFTKRNLAIYHLVPSETLKHISRIFYLPYACSDVAWLHENNHLRALIQQGAVFKIQSSPKNLERLVAEVLIGDSDEDGNPCPFKVSPDHIHPSKCTHIVQVVYSAHESLFRWGIVSATEAEEEQCMTSTALERAVGAGHLALLESTGEQPASRAFFKMQEIFEVFFPKWGWNTNIRQVQKAGNLRAVDVGASPGGWTQYLSPLCHSVLAIDPGLLLPGVLSLKNITYVPHVVESVETRKALSVFTSADSLHENVRTPSNVCVCDVNIEPHIAAMLLVDHIFPFMTGGKNCCPDTKSSDDGGYVILTLKLPRNPSQRRIASSYRIACDILSQNDVPKFKRRNTGNENEIIGSYDDDNSSKNMKISNVGVAAKCWGFQMVYLNANSRNERTLVCRIGGKE